MNEQRSVLLSLLARANELCVEKYEVQPYYEAELTLAEHSEWLATITTIGYSNRHSARADSPEIALGQIIADLEAAPDKAELDRREFQRELSALIDKGRDLGIDESFVNPLTVMSQKLAENALTFQPDE